MNLSTKAVILLVLFNSLEYGVWSQNSTANKIQDLYGCDDETALNQKTERVMKCIENKYDIKDNQSANDIGETKLCCGWYNLECTLFKLILKMCSPKPGFDDDVRQTYGNVTEKCVPTKKLCAKYHTGTVDKSLCAEYTYSECESYKPFVDIIINEKNRKNDRRGKTDDRRGKTDNSFAPISVNGWALCLSLFVSVLIVV